MKKLWVLVVCSIFLFCLTGCNKEDLEQEESTSDNEKNQTINLNDNVEVYVQMMGLDNGCGFLMFTTNFRDVFPAASIDEYNRVQYWVGDDTVDGEISQNQLEENFDQLQFDGDQEERAEKLLKEIGENDYSGVKEFSYHYLDHKFQYTYSYIEFADDRYVSDSKDIALQLENTFKTAIQFNGTCGSGDYTTTLDEPLCDEYHLTCDRW